MAEKIQWHPGFYAGMELELKAFDLSFDSEYQLTRGPLSIDLLIIKKLSDQKIDVDFAECFRRHNIVEFKSPEDELSIDVFYKTQAYACLYKASGDTVNAIPADEITVSLFRDVYPREMMDQLKEQGFSAEERHPGVYQISGPGYFLTQVIVTSRLSPDQHTILRILSNHAQRADVERFIRASRAFVNSGDFQRVDAILQVSASANEELYRKLRKEDEDMCQALREIMKEDFEAAEARGLEKGMQKGMEKGMEKGMLEGMEKGMEKGIEKGMEKGENQLSSLITRLKELGRTDDVFKAAADKQYRDKLYKEFRMA